ncbi:MAG: hypothetical protein IKL80_03150 [Clostridia bacterium]|nr:hypothetical protein [Clostridia bacterium]
MKNTITFLLVVMCLLSLVGCGKKHENQAEPTPSAVSATGAPIDQEETEPAEKKESTATLAPSTNKTVVTKEEAPEVYWDFGIAYHLKDCKEMSEQAQLVNWELVEQVALRQCPVCNPPQYENYIENNE